MKKKMRFLLRLFCVAMAALFLNIAFTSVQSAVAKPTDFDGDGKTDFAVFRRSENAWYILKSTGGTISQIFGQQGDDIVPEDFDGDGKTDFAVYRSTPPFPVPGPGVFYVWRSSDDTLQVQPWGLSGDGWFASNDYDGDGKADFGVHRRSEAGTTWYILLSADNTFRAVQWGIDRDLPQPGDYDGDGKADFTVQRRAQNLAEPASFYTLQSSDNTLNARQWGLGADLNVPGDYDGDGKTDTAVYRSTPFSGPSAFYVLNSSGGIISQQWGILGDRPAPGDYDGDGKTDFAVWRPSDGTFYVLKSSDGGFIFQQWGQSGDMPVAGYRIF